MFGADLDRDGDVDVMSASAEDDKIAWYENDAARPPKWTTHVISSTTLSATAVYARDMDGDSDVDVISGGWGNEVAWYENDGASPPSFNKHVNSMACNGAESVFAARVDGDADVDVLCASNLLWKVNLYDNNANFLETE